MITLLLSALRQGIDNYRQRRVHAAMLAAYDRTRPARGRWNRR